MKIGACELELPPTQAGQSGKPRIPTHQPQASPYEQFPAHRSPHCQTSNRVRADQLASAPDCGQCKQPLFTGKPVDLAKAAFDKHLQRNQIPLLVNIWAPGRIGVRLQLNLTCYLIRSCLRMYLLACGYFL